MKNFTKLIAFSTLLSLPSSSFVAYAVSDTRFTTIGEAQPILENAFNIFVYVAAIVMVAMIAFGVWKSSMAIGDPRGLESAKQTWTYALFGFMVIVLFFVIFNIVARLFGVTSLGGPRSILGKVFEAIESLISVPSNCTPNCPDS